MLIAIILQVNAYIVLPSSSWPHSLSHLIFFFIFYSFYYYCNYCIIFTDGLIYRRKSYSYLQASYFSSVSESILSVKQLSNPTLSELYFGSVEFNVLIQSSSRYYSRIYQQIHYVTLLSFYN